MKKLFLALSIIFILVQGFGQTYFSRNKITADTIKVNYYFIWQGDTIKFDQLSSVQFSSDTIEWHTTQVSTDKYFRIKTTRENYYRHLKIWDGKTLDLDNHRIINVDTAIELTDAINLGQLIDSMLSVSSRDISYDTTGTIYDSTTVQGAITQIGNLHDRGPGGFKKVIYVKNHGTNPIQNTIDTIDYADGTVLLLLDAGYFNEKVTLTNKQNIFFSSLGNAVTHIRRVVITDNSSFVTSSSWTNIIIDSTSIAFSNASYKKDIVFFNCLFLSTFTASGQNNDPSGHALLFRSSGMFTLTPATFTNGLFISSEESKWVGFTLSGNTVFQHSSGEFNGTFTLNNTSIVFIRNDGVHAYPLTYAAEFILNNTSILNIDAQSFSTTKITNNTGTEASVQLLEGVYTGVISPRPIIVGNGNGTINIPTGQVYIYDNDHNFSLPRRYIVPAQTNVSLTNNLNNYIDVFYNGGSPVYTINTTNLRNESDRIPVADYFREGTILHSFNWDALGEGKADKIHRRIIDTEEFKRKTGGGLILGEAPTRLITISAGSGYFGAVPISFNACNSSTSTVYFYYPVANVWTKGTPTTYNNTQYSDGTNLQTLLSNKWVNNWIYRGKETSDHIYYVLGNTYGSLQLAQEEQPPSSLPEIMKVHAFLIGRITVVQGGTTGTIQSIFTTSFTQSPVTVHGNLSGLSADDHSQYAFLLGRAGGQALIGGTGITDILKLQGTTGNGTLTSPAIQFLVGNNGATTAATFLNNSNFGIGTVSPTAVLHLKAGTATAGTAPLKLTSGTLLTTPEAGAIEFLTDSYYATITTGAARKKFYFAEDIKIFEKELSVSENNINVGFTLTSTSMVYINGSLIQNVRWSGEGSSTLNISIIANNYDKLTVYK